MLAKRLARVEDDSFLYEVYKSTRMEEVTAWGWQESEREAFLFSQWTLQRNSYQLQFPDSDNFIVSFNGSDVGRMMLKSTNETNHLIDLSLLPSYRNQGIGSSLLITLQQDSFRNQQVIILHVTPHNPARRLYERLGFQLQEALDFYWQMVWQPLNSNVDLREENKR